MGRKKVSRARRPEVKNITAKVDAPTKDQEVGDKFLTETEFYKLEHFDAKFACFSQEINNKKLKKQSLMTNLELLEMKMSDTKLKMNLLDGELKHCVQLVKDYSEERKTLVKPIQKRLNLPDKFGYDMDTRKIILDE